MCENQRNQPPADDAGVEPAHSPALLDPIVDCLGASGRTHELARELASTVEDTMWVVGQRRTTVAATAMYVAAQAADESFTQADVAACSEVSGGAISQHKRGLLTVYVQAKADAATPRLRDLDPASL